MSENVNIEPATGPETPKAPQLNLNDLVNVLQVFRTCAQRGAIRVDEMAQVGGLYDRLQSFLLAAGALKPAGDPEPTKDAN